MIWPTERRRNQCLSRVLLKSERRLGACGASTVSPKDARLGSADAGERLDAYLSNLWLKGAGDVC